MAKTQHYFFQGKLKWVRTLTPNEWGKWTCTVYPNAEGLKTLHELKSKGLKNIVKKDEDGEYVTFSRSTQKIIKGKTVGFAPPEVLQPDGVTPLRDQAVGNGSDGTVKIEVYYFNIPGLSGQKGVAARLHSIRVDNLVPYKVSSGFEEDQLDMIEGQAEQPTQPLF